MRQKKHGLLLLLCFFSIGIWAQTRTISGTVLNEEDNSPMPGVTVINQNSNTGTTTDIDGKYSIKVDEVGTKLSFRFIGFSTVEKTVGAENTINVGMGLDALNLSEVVVTGQGVGIDKKRIATTVSTITSKELKSIPATQLDQLIQSKLPNAQIKISSGQPGTASIIRSRGPVSAITNTTPIIFIDGIRVDNLNSNPSLGIATGGAQSSAIADIPMEDVDRIEYIPGGAATTLYGADAANGVLQIFTKRGKAGNNDVNFEIQMGGIKGTADYLKYKETADLYFKPGFMQNYRLGFTGGDAKTNYSFSGNLYQDDSFNDLNETIRRNMRTSLSTQVNEKLRYSTSFALSNLEFTRDYNANTSFARFGNLEGGSYGDLSTLTAGALDTLKEDLANQGKETDLSEEVTRFSFSNNFKYNISKNLVAVADIGVDSRNSVQREHASNAMLISKGSIAPGTTDQGEITISERNFTVISGNFNLQHNYEKDDFSFITTVGAQIFRENDVQRRILANSVVDGSVSINNSSSQKATDFFRVVTSSGIYVAENFGFKDKLFLDLGLRFDGNSAFGDEVGLVALPKIGVAYILSDAPFFADNVPTNIISAVKLRANYGQSSIFPKPFANDLTFEGPSYLNELSYAFNNPGNPELTSEIATTYEIGADLSVFKSKVNLGVTYYNTTTDGALFTPPANPSSGQNSQMANVGVIKNSGVELSAQVSVLSNKDHDVTFGVSYNYNDNSVESTGGAPEFSVGGFSFLGSFVKEGMPLGYLRGNRTTVDAQGNPLVENQAFLGTTFSPSFGSFNVSYTYKKKFSLFINGDYQWGGQGVAVDDVLRYFGGVNDEGRIPTELENESFFDLASYWVEDTKYLKIRNISTSYKLGNVYGFKNASIGFSVLNAFNFVSASFDPDVSGAGIATQAGFAGGGFGFGTESAPRMFVGTIKFSL
tara:strand:+ start:149986 stop:152799 length:2814 start_codon:yes stop_codon:yes gene_type:complete